MQRDDLMVKILLTILGACFLSFVAVSFFISHKERHINIYVDWNSPQFIGERSGQYSAIFANEKLNEKLPDKVLEEFEAQKEEFAIARSNAELIRLYGISFKENTLSDLAIECNSKLFDICNKYFLATYGGQQLSPLIPMAVANIETPGRADQSVTYSALFPSKYIKIKSADAISNMSCLAVLESADTFKALASDHWTRDRGALQMNPNYGTGYEAFNSLMGPSEASILSNVSGSDLDFTDYSAYEPRNSRTLTVDDWLSMLSTEPGDRFNVRDSVLRMAASAQGAIDDYSSQYVINNDMEIMCLIAMQHNSGSVWNVSYKDSKVGNWRSGDAAYRYCLGVTSDKFIAALRHMCDDRLLKARENGTAIPMQIERSEAKKLFEDAQIGDYSTYVYEGRYYEVSYCYPIQALYAYMMLGLVYSGK